MRLLMRIIALVLYKYTSANFSSLIFSLSIPLSVTFWIICQHLKITTTNISTLSIILDYVSIVVILIGIWIYTFTKKQTDNDLNYNYNYDSDANVNIIIDINDEQVVKNIFAINNNKNDIINV
jgi:hypothetical protein